MAHQSEPVRHKLKMKVRPKRPTANRPNGLSPGLLLWPKPKMEQRTRAAVQKPKVCARLGVVNGRYRAERPRVSVNCRYPRRKVSSKSATMRKPKAQTAA